jgi:hypothetical protein
MTGQTLNNAQLISETHGTGGFSSKQLGLYDSPQRKEFNASATSERSRGVSLSNKKQFLFAIYLWRRWKSCT